MSKSREGRASRHVMVWVSFWFMVLTAPAPLMACVVMGRAGWFALIMPITFGLTLLAQYRHEDVMDCPRCAAIVNHVVGFVEQADPLPAFVPTQRRPVQPVLVPVRGEFAQRYAAHVTEFGGGR
jgi:hypothetical protein